MKSKKKATHKAFEKYYKTQLSTPDKILWNQLDSKEMVKAFKYFNISKKYTVVSSGCGTGQKEMELYKTGYHSIIAFDFSKTAIALAKKNDPDIKIDFQTGDMLRLETKMRKKLSEKDVWVDWMSMHNMNKEQQIKAAKIIAKLSPHYLIFRTFSKEDPEYIKNKVSLQNSILPGIFRHFSDLKDIQLIFPTFSLLKILKEKPFNNKKFIDKRAAAKLTVLMVNNDYNEK